MGFIKAIKNFDSNYNVKLSTYVFPVIVGEIKRFLRDDGVIKVSRSLKELCVKIKYFKEKYVAQNNEEPTIEQIVNEFKVPKEEIILALESDRKPESIYSTQDSSEDRALNLIDKIATQKNEEQETIDKITLSKIIKNLEPREKQIIVLRYFRDKTQSEVAKMIGISQVQISRMEKKILNNMKKQIS